MPGGPEVLKDDLSGVIFMARGINTRKRHAGSVRVGSVDAVS